MAGGEKVEVVSAWGGWGKAREGKVKVVEGDPGWGGGVVKRVCYEEVVKGIG